MRTPAAGDARVGELTDPHIPDQVQFWNRWHRRRRTSGREPARLQLRNLFLRGLEPNRAPLNVLDLGCGQGHDAVAFAAAGHHVWAMDFSPEALAVGKQARRRLGPWEDRVRLVQGDLAQPLPFGDDRFDAVYSLFALHYFPHDVTRRIVGQIRRVTRPGGWLTLGVKSVDDPYFGHGEQLAEHMYCRNGHVRRFFTEGDLRELLRDWHDVEVETRHGRYGGSEPSVFICATAGKPAAGASSRPQVSIRSCASWQPSAVVDQPAMHPDAAGGSQTPEHAWKRSPPTN